jgi:hypothetical protein
MHLREREIEGRYSLHALERGVVQFSSENVILLGRLRDAIHFMHLREELSSFHPKMLFFCKS